MDRADLIAQRLGEQVARGQVVLFTGAGFSYGATDSEGVAVPQVTQLKREIWELVWPGEAVPDESSLGDTFAAALLRGRNRLRDLLLRRLTIDPESVTEQHALWLRMPWRRAYTLNIDNLEAAAQRRYELPRGIQPVSALARSVPLDTTQDLLYVHLNGTLDDVPDVTFSEPQYGSRHGVSSPLYEKLAADLVSYPVVFVGTELRESLFWQYVAMRSERGARGTSEMRPRSYLVTPTLPHDREAMLSAYNIEWVRATSDEFADEVLTRLNAEAQQGHLARRITTSPPGAVVLPTVADVASLPPVPGSEYLMGARPEWADITEGRAAERTFEAGIDMADLKGCLVVTGTAGAGTSTVLKRLALRAAAASRDTRWVDANHGFGARDLARHLRGVDEPLVLVVDDADTFGPPLKELVDDVLDLRPDDLLVVGMRASRVDHILPGWRADGDRRHEVNVPLLEDADINALLEVLTRNNRLGALLRLSHEQRVSVVRGECGRELLIAMIEATSGERFSVKVAQEYADLDGPQQMLYGIAALASELRFGLTRDELLVASGDIGNATLYALDRLVARKLLVARPEGYAVRHRRIAELVVAGMRRSATLYAPYAGLLWSIAIRVEPRRRNTRETKLLTALLNHERVLRNFAVDDGRQLYESVEEPLAQDYHFWLQRGSLEVERGSLPAARNYLQSAFAGGDHDFRLHTEWAYYLIKSARSDPKAADASARVREAEAVLLKQIERRGDQDSYAYHVYGSQMLSWLRRAPINDDDRARQLENIKNRVKDGCERHPDADDLHDLHRDIESEWLSLAIPPELR